MIDASKLDALVSPLAESFSGQVAVAFQSFETGESYTYRATETLRAASLIKLPVLLCALTEVAKGKLSLEQRFSLKLEDQVGGSGVLWRLQPGLEPTLHDLLTLMIIVSDNTATNLLIECVGVQAINTYLQGLGLSQTKLVGKLQLADSATRESNATCAADVLGLLVQLERRDLLPDELTETALDILKKQQFTEALARYLPTDAELSDAPVTVASKSGCLRGLWHDAGTVYRHDGTPWYALVVMTEDAADRSYSWEQEGMMLIARLSRDVYEAQSRHS